MVEDKNNLKNVIIINDFDYVQGGASKVAIDTANLLAKETNLKIYFFSANSKNNSFINERVEKISTFQEENLKDKNKIRGCFNGIYNIKARKKLDNLLKTLNREETIVHIHGWTKCLSSSIFVPIIKQKYKFVITLHDYFTICPNGGFFNYKTNLICENNPFSVKCLMCNCDSRNIFFKYYRMIRMFIQNKCIKLIDNLENIITISDLSEQVFKKYFSSNIKFKRITNPIDFDIEAKRVDVKENDYYIYVGRVSKEKGVELFCKAVSELNKKGVVVGDGYERERLQKQYKNIEFVGWQSIDKVKQFMKQSRCLIFPSLWYEGAPLTPLEAMQYGIPCLISNKCSAKEYIKDNGMLIENNVEDIKDKIIKINENITFYSNNAFEYCKKLKKRNYVDEIYKAYLEIMEKI